MSDIAQDMGGVVLLPCPFCGREPRLVDLAGYEVLCGCGASMVTGPTQAEAIAAWNTRAHSSEIAGALAAFQRVRDALEQPDLIGPASHFRSEEEVIQTRVLRTLIRHELNWHTAMQQGGGGGE